MDQGSWHRRFPLSLLPFSLSFFHFFTFTFNCTKQFWSSTEWSSSWRREFPLSLLSFAYSLFHFHLDKIILVFYRWISQLAPWIPVIRQTSRNIESLDWQPVSWSWHRGLEYPNTTYQWYHIHSSKTYEIYKNKETHKHKNLRNNFGKISQILRESIDNQFHPCFDIVCLLLCCFHGGFVETCIFPFVGSNPELSLEFPLGPSTSPNPPLSTLCFTNCLTCRSVLNKFHQTNLIFGICSFIEWKGI